MAVTKKAIAQKPNPALYTLMLIGLNPFGALLLGSIAERVGNPNALLLYGLILAAICAYVPFKYKRVRAI